MDNIDLYYQSLKQVLDDLEAWEPPKPRFVQRVVDWLLGTAIVLFILCLIPIIPTVLILLRATLPIHVAGLDTSSGSFSAFGTLWLITAIATGLVLFPTIWANDKIDKRFETSKGPPRTLSNDQIAFVKTYEAYKELKVFFVSHLDRHVENAHQAIESQLGRRVLLPHVNDEWLLDEKNAAAITRIPREPDDEVLIRATVRGYPPSFFRAVRGSLSSQLSAGVRLLGTFSKYDWFRLDPDTDSALRALVSLPSRILYRLRDQEELPQVLEVLEHLSRFLYAFLPEHATDRQEDELVQLREQGRTELSLFVASINRLTEYRGKQIEKSRALNGKAQLREVAARLYSRFVFARFVFWFMVLMILTSAGVVVLNQFIPISPDTMATIVIGSSVAGAVGLAAFLPRQSESK